MLLALVAVQLFGAVAFASVCLEPCPDDDADGSSCPPVCTACTTCSHSRTATLQSTRFGFAIASTGDAFPQHDASPSSAFTRDIFHVPLSPG
jgi:hypothetical protein